MASLHLTGVLITTVLAISACASSDDDNDPVVDNGSGDTSMLAPEGGDDSQPISDTPGGDTSAIAGFFDASDADDTDSRYLEIAANGLYTEHFRDLDANCFLAAGPRTLTPEGADDYSIASGGSFHATLNADDTVLDIDYLDDELPVNNYPRVVGRVPEDLPSCTDRVAMID